MHGKMQMLSLYHHVHIYLHKNDDGTYYYPIRGVRNKLGREGRRCYCNIWRFFSYLVCMPQGLLYLLIHASIIYNTLYKTHF